MEIAYLVHLNMGPKTGVFKKVTKQVESWMELGEQVCLYVLTRDEDVRRGLDGKASCYFYEKGSCRDRLMKMRSVVDKIITSEPDIAYLRQDHFYPAYARLERALPTILEINSDVNEELRGYSKTQWLYNKCTESQLWRRCSGAVFVTGELAGRKAAYLAGRPARVIANGLGLAGRRPVEATDIGAPPTLFFLGSMGMPWNGFDKILYLAQTLKEWHFHLVGAAEHAPLHVPPNIHLHGVLTEEEYSPLLKASDVAISTLALHRKRMNEASPLKTREYLAYGLPVIIGYKDTDFPDEPDFLLRLENREDNVERSIDRIRDFVLRWKGKRVPREQVLRIDAVGKEKARIAFFKTVLGQS